MAPTLHLYMTPGSVALASHIALHESALPFTTSDLGAQRGFPAAHLDINPKGRVPVLAVDNDLITETPAILTTIAALVPEKNLLGVTLLEQARAHEWMAWLCGTVHGQAFGCLFRPARFVGEEVVKARGKECVRECFEFIEGKLEGRKFAVGEAFTVVDAYLFVFFRWGNFLKFSMKESYPNYASVVYEVVKRDAVKKAIEAEGIDALSD
jgi:glutathione S-transferase